MDDLISRLSDLRSQYNLFDEAEQDAYHTLTEAIAVLNGVNESAQPENEKRTAETAQNVPNGDLISRKMAIDALGERPTVWTTDDEYSLGARNQYDTDKLAVETVQPAQPAQQWIPCSERLPEDYVDVLVWFEYFRYGDYNRLYQTHGIGDYSSKYDSWMINHESGWRKLRVYAWMPLPEPYKPPTRSQYRRMKEQRGEQE